MRQKLTTRVVEFLAHFHVRVRECARTGTFLLLTVSEKVHRLDPPINNTHSEVHSTTTVDGIRQRRTQHLEEQPTIRH